MTEEEIAEFKDQIKRQVINDLKSERAVAMEESTQRKKEEKEERAKYITKMKESPEPWVDIIGWIETEQGVRVELEWNDAFVAFLQTEGVTGTDEDQIVQKWVAMLLRNVADDMGDKAVPDGESTFQG